MKARREALRELHAKRVLMRYETDILRGKHMKVVDAKYTLHPDMELIVEVMNSNSRTLQLGERGVSMDNDIKEALSLP